MQNEKKRVEKQLQKKEKQYRQIFESVAEGLIIVDINGNIIQANPAACNIYGYTLEEIKNLKPKDLVHPDYHHNIDEFFRDVQEKGVYATETIDIKKNGDSFYTEVRGAKILLDNKPYFMAIIRDITERKKLEQNLHAREILIGSILESTHDNIAVVDKTGSIIMVNRAWEDFASDNSEGKTVNAHVGTNYFDVCRNAKGDFSEEAADSLAGLEAVLNGRLDHFDLQYPCHSPLIERWFLMRAVPLKAPLGGLVISHINITETKRIENELREHRINLENIVEERTRELSEKNKELQRSQQSLQYLLEDVNEVKRDLEKANEKLKELDRLKSMFIASMSHELRTPLNSIIGFTGIILQGMTGEINPEQKDHLQRVYNAAKHLLSLITDIIDISKVEAGKIEPYFEEFMLDELIDEAVSVLRPQIDESGLMLDVRVPKGLRVKSDRKRLLQCVINYISNALKFTEKGSISINAGIVRKGKAMGRDLIEITVADTGIGIKDEDREKLFKPFMRLQTNLKKTIPGTGLGLYLVKKLANEVLKGNVFMKSESGIGSTFGIVVPVEITSKEESRSLV